MIQVPKYSEKILGKFAKFGGDLIDLALIAMKLYIFKVGAGLKSQVKAVKSRQSTLQIWKQRKHGFLAALLIFD